MWHTFCDEDIPTNDTTTPPTPSISIAGPITRGYARQLKHQVSSLFYSDKSYLDCGDMCTLLLIRNHGEERTGKGIVHAGFGLQHNTKS